MSQEEMLAEYATHLHKILWRSTDKDGLMACYGFSESIAEKICEALLRFELELPRPWYVVSLEGLILWEGTDVAEARRRFDQIAPFGKMEVWE